MKLKLRTWLAGVADLFRGDVARSEQAHQKAIEIERRVVFPVKVLYLLMLAVQLIWIPGHEDLDLPRSVAQKVVDRFFYLYLGINAVVPLVLFSTRRLQLKFVQRVMLASSLVDGLFLAGLTSVTGGFDSPVYWLFLGLIVRNALICPMPLPQMAMNLSISLCYLVAGVWDIAFTEELDEQGNPVLRSPAEPFLLRLMVLVLWTAFCCVLKALLDRQRAAEEEAREYASRSDQLRSAGRLASEIAHQIKNPLGIINNAAYALQRAVQEAKGDPMLQVQIIREEVSRADRIITELVGYAQLAEGKVERLDINEELERAVAEVFPAGTAYNVKVETDFQRPLPALLMQRRHLSEILLNLIKNAREAFTGRGRILLRTRLGPDESVVVTIADDGPGISPAKLGRIFEPYFTTKEKGTGLGLSIVKHNVEIYDGTVDVQSELGKGTKFILTFPTRTFMRVQS
ncbi:MAG TPA: ATP-binding protein [Methylomirabilota bacterium]|nr:ATP-binding protein [Methylomirabilota bacterium]